VLDRAATVADAGAAKILRDELAKTDPATVDVRAATSALETLFPCRSDRSGRMKRAST
jgi:hypothetical protein